MSTLTVQTKYVESYIQQNGIFPEAVSFSTELHSIGEYIQEGI